MSRALFWHLRDDPRFLASRACIPWRLDGTDYRVSAREVDEQQFPCEPRRTVRLGAGMQQIVRRHPGMLSAENELTPPQDQIDIG